VRNSILNITFIIYMLLLFTHSKNRSSSFFNNPSGEKVQLFKGH
jgi:hypothetical protein